MDEDTRNGDLSSCCILYEGELQEEVLESFVIEDPRVWMRVACAKSAWYSTFCCIIMRMGVIPIMPERGEREQTLCTLNKRSR